MPAPRPTPKQMQERREYVSRLMLDGMTLDQVIAACEREFGLTASQARYVYDQINETWARQSEADLRYARPQAIQRIRRDLVQMRAETPLRDRDGQPVREIVRDAAGKPLRKGKKYVRRVVVAPKDWKSITSHEQLLAKVEGTLRPVELKVDPASTTRTALLAVISNLSPEQMDQLVDRQAELEALEKQAKSRP